MKHHAIFLLLTTACFPLPPDDMDTDTGETDSGGSTGASGTTDPSTTTGPSTSSTAGSSTTSTTNATDSGGSSTGQPELCLYHCFRRVPPVSFPYVPDPIDVDGNPSGVPLTCDAVPTGTLNLLGVSFPLDEPACVYAGGQAEAALVHDQGVCNAGPVQQPPDAAWSSWVVNYATEHRQACVAVLMAMGCKQTDDPAFGGSGAQEICQAYLEFPLRLDMEVSAPQLEEIEPDEAAAFPSGCDYQDNLACG